MCTAVTYRTKDFYFGRTLDYDFSYCEEITITPRNYIFDFKNMGRMSNHYAIIGMAYVVDDYPLYYDAVNEKGLGMAGLNFVGNAVYSQNEVGRDNIASFEFIPWILGKCASVSEARVLLDKINIVDTHFSDELSPAQLHWIIADREETIIVESVCENDTVQIKVYDNPVGVLTNNPPFDEQMLNLSNYMHLSPKEPQNNFSENLNLKAYSRGMGAIGLPGDLSSQSRFVRAAFTKMNSISGSSEEQSVSQFFHILSAVSQTRGCCETEDGKFEITIYTSCCNADKGIYYYTTYDNHQITAVDLHSENLETDRLIRYPLILDEKIRRQN